MARLGIVLLIGACLPLTACEPVAIALLGAGASTALRYNMDGVTARTFTADAATVRTASLAAAERMGLQVGNSNTFDNGETVIEVRAPNRAIDIELEPITPHATRLRVTARSSGWIVDTATAAELVSQTERVLDAQLAARLAPVPASSAAGGTAAKLISN